MDKPNANIYRPRDIRLIKERGLYMIYTHNRYTYGCEKLCGDPNCDHREDTSSNRSLKIKFLIK